MDRCTPKYLIEGTRGKGCFVTFPDKIEKNMIQGAWRSHDKITRVEDNHILIWESKDTPFEDHTWVHASEAKDYLHITSVRQFEEYITKIARVTLIIGFLIIIVMALYSAHQNEVFPFS